ALGLEDVADLLGRLLEEPGLRRHGAAHADHARQRLLRGDLRRIETMVPRRGAEVPHPGLAVAGEQAPARELVARPLADDRPREVADIVLIEDEDGAQPRAGQRLAGAAQTIGVQAAEVDALLEVHLHVAGGLERPVPAVARVHVLGRHGPERGCGLARHRILLRRAVWRYS